ncbi:MAG: tail fiber domain-containing protein [Saprospiraceae bacterium]|nr:tail fiber domain-containing protein [Lewinella sp.]
MKNKLIPLLLSVLILQIGQAQVRLNVSGNATIHGKLDLLRSADDPSIFIGSNAGIADEGQNNNIFMGNNAGSINTSGNRNIFIGPDSGKGNLSGENNTFLGFETGIRNSLGSGNTFIGSRAGSLNSQGHSNTFLGYLAGHYNGNGTRNTFLGNSSGRGLDNDMLDRAIAIGYLARVNCSNCAIIGGTGTNSVKLGIGTENPEGALHLLTTGEPPAGLEADENGLLLGVESTTGYKWIQSYGGSLVLNLMGNTVGVGTAAVDYSLEVNGTAGKPGGGEWTNSASDRRLKRNIRPYTDGLWQLLKIRPVWYQYNGKAELPADREFVGIIAQEMQDIAPYTVGSFQYEGTDYLNFDGSALRFMIINAIKELHEELTHKEKRIDELVVQNEKLQEQLDELSARFDHWLKQQSPDTDDQGSNYTLPLEQKAMLFPNRPNPFSDRTIVQYRVPPSFREASIQVSSADGKVLGSTVVKAGGDGEVIIETGNYSAGTYYYSLIIDGEIVDTKVMIKK